RPRGPPNGFWRKHFVDVRQFVFRSVPLSIRLQWPENRARTQRFPDGKRVDNIQRSGGAEEQAGQHGFDICIRCVEGKPKVDAALRRALGTLSADPGSEGRTDSLRSRRVRERYPKHRV